MILGASVHLLFGFPLLEAMLLGAIVSSTDAAAVLAVLRSKGVSLAGRLRPLLELESGSNDPMAVFLTVAIVSLLTDPGASLTTVLARLPLQMALGGLLGYLAGRAIPVVVNRLELGYDGLYPVLTLAAVLLTFGVTDRVGGNGFLAVYVAGLVAGNQDFLHRRSLLSFHDGLAWLMQIAMFLTLGLLVFPSRLMPVAGVGLGVTALLIFVARPLSVFLLLWPSKLRTREKLLLSWVGLRGAVPIILATYPLLAGVAGAEAIFNAVFFVVLISVLLQGTTIPRIARWLGVDAPLELRRQYPIEYNPMTGLRSTLHEVPINERSPAAGRSIVELRLPPKFLIILVARGSEFIVPNGGTRLRPGDTLLALSEDAALDRACAMLGCEGPIVPGTSTTDDGAKTDSQVA
jgi:potassium/hydrogen antiporter